MTTHPHAPSNPLARAASAIPDGPALAVSVTARVVGAAAALYYAYDQDTLFPGRHFPRTWVFALVIAGVALLSLLPWTRILPKRAGLGTWLGALGGGILLFGGANLAHKPAGVVVLAAGIIAWPAFAAAATQRERRDPGSLVSGLLMGSLVSFVLVGICVLLIGG